MPKYTAGVVPRAPPAAARCLPGGIPNASERIGDARLSAFESAMHALILATPKAFVELGGRPLLIRLTDTLSALGCETTTALVRHSAVDGARASAFATARPAVRMLSCETSSSLHTLTRGLEAVPPGPLLCARVDSVLRRADWQALFTRADSLLRAGADACVAITPFGEEEQPLYVARHPDGSVSAFQGEPTAPALVTGGVYFLSSRIRSLAPRVLALGIIRIRGFLRWLVEHGYRVETAEVERIVDLDRDRDLTAAAAWLSESGCL